MSRDLKTEPYASRNVMATTPYVARAQFRKTARRAVGARSSNKRPYRRRYVRKSQSNRGKSQNQGLRIEIPDCSQHYIKALYNPYDVPAGVCIPCDLFPLPSQKVMVKQRFTVKLTTNGCAFVNLAPSIANDVASGSYTTDGVGNTTSVFTAGASWTQTEIFFANLPYSNADIETNKQVSGRIVAFGVRARYIGLEEKRGGAYISLEEQDHQDIYANTSYNTIDKIKSFPNAYVTSPKGDGTWDVSVGYSGPINPFEMEFVNDVYPIKPTAGSTDVNPMILCFSGTTDMAGQIIDCEACIHVEYIGKKVPGKTVSHADSSSYGKVIETTKEAAAVGEFLPENRQKGFMSFMSKMAETVPKLITLGGGLISSIATGNPMPLIGAGASVVAPLLLKDK